MYVCVYAKDIKKILPHKLRDKHLCQKIRDKLMQIPAMLLRPDNRRFDTGGYTDTMQ